MSKAFILAYRGGKKIRINIKDVLRVTAIAKRKTPCIPSYDLEREERRPDSTEGSRSPQR